MRIELEVAGHEVDFVSINRDDGVESQELLTKKCAFPQLQDTEELGIWSQMAGFKDDFYVFNPDGTLHTYLKFFGDIPTNLAEDDGYTAVKGAILSALEGKGPEPEGDADAEAPDTPEPATDTATATDTGPEPDTEDAPQSPSDTAAQAPDAD